MKYKLRIINAAFFTFLMLTWQAGAAGHFEPDAPYYFDSFEPTKNPWNPGQKLNYEEVFKNYQYFEIIFAPSGKEITVNRYIQNTKKDSEQYLLNPDGSISKKLGN